MTKPGGQRRVSMKISDAPVASKAGKNSTKCRRFVFFCDFLRGGFEDDLHEILTVIYCN